jgi:hypothetical protein
VKPLLSAGVLAMAVAGVAAYAVTAVVAEANLRMGTVTRNPVEAIQKTLATLKTDRRMLDKALVLASSWQADSDEPAQYSPDQTSAPVAWPVALLRADDEDPAKAAVLAHKAASALQDPRENKKVPPDEAR